MLTQIVFLINLFFAIQHVLSLWLFSVIKYRPQKIVLPACPGDLPACPPKRTKVKGKCAGVPSIYILQPDHVIIYHNLHVLLFGAWSIWIYRLCRKKNTLWQSDRFVSSYSRRPSTVFREGRWKTVDVCVELTFQNGSQNKRCSDMYRQML